MKNTKLQWLILVVSILYVTVAVGLAIAIIVYRFQNPTLTETQLFLLFAPYTLAFLLASFVLGYAWSRWMP